MTSTRGDYLSEIDFNITRLTKMMFDVTIGSPKSK